MRKRMKPGRPSHATVVAYLALFIALGGSAYAVGNLGKNTVGPKQLKKSAVTTAKIKKEAVTAAKVKKGALTGTQINISTLGTVPSAANAQTLGGLSADQIAQSSKLRCPAGTELSSGVCFETAARPFATFGVALETCASIDRSLPSGGELATYLRAKQEKEKPHWTGTFFTDSGFFASIVLINESGVVGIGSSALSSPNSYRCVTGPSN